MARVIRQLDRLTPEHFERMNTGRRYWDASLESVDDDTPHKEPLLKYTTRKGLFEARKKGWGVMLWGDNSCGKTYAASAVLNRVVTEGFSGFCIASDVLKTVYINHKMFDPDLSVVQRVETVDFLLIEDLGKEYSGKDFGWAELCFENLMRKRSREQRPTLITTNLSPQKLLDRYRKSAIAIAQESMMVVNVKGPNYRARQALEIKRAYQ